MPVAAKHVGAHTCLSMPLCALQQGSIELDRNSACLWLIIKAIKTVSMYTSGNIYKRGYLVTSMNTHTCVYTHT